MDNIEQVNSSKTADEKCSDTGSTLTINEKGNKSISELEGDECTSTDKRTKILNKSESALICSEVDIISSDVTGLDIKLNTSNYS